MYEKIKFTNPNDLYSFFNKNEYLTILNKNSTSVQNINNPTLIFSYEYLNTCRPFNHGVDFSIIFFFNNTFNLLFLIPLILLSINIKNIIITNFNIYKK